MPDSICGKPYVVFSVIRRLYEAYWPPIVGDETRTGNFNTFAGFCSLGR